MSGSDTRGCNNCDSMLTLMNAMNEKLSKFDDRFTQMESLMKSENEKLRTQLERANKKYDEAVEKMDAMASEINRLKQINISRNVIIKGVPEMETDAEHLKSMIGVIFAKLRYNFPLTFIDCYRIGRKSENTCRPIVVVLPSVGLKNMMIRDKRTMKLTCANFSNDGLFWGKEDQIIYIDEHLTRENHMLFMEARKLRQYGFKFIWTRNGRIFVRHDEKAKSESIVSIRQLAKLVIEARSYAKQMENQAGDEAQMETDHEHETEPEIMDDLARYENIIENSPMLRPKRKKDSPHGHTHEKGPKRHHTRSRK